MTILPALLAAACLLLPVAAWSEDAPLLPAVVGDTVYKGVVGKALDAVPMDAERRVVLQRTNAVVSNALTARSLSVWVLGLANPIFLVGGVVWGLFAASNIKANEARPAPDTLAVEMETGDRIFDSTLVVLDSHLAPLRPDQHW